MSYLTMLPNCYYNSSSQISQLTSPYLLNQNHINTQNVLSFLKTALTISVNNYQLNYQHNSSISTPAPQIVEKLSSAGSIPIETLEILQSHEKIQEIPLKNVVQEKQIGILNSFVGEVKETRKDPFALTDDELLTEERQKNSKKNQLSSKKKGKKIKEDVISDFVVPVPEVDKIDTAYLPLFSLERQELANKREELLMRKVEDWSQFNKGKKDKRELRMLSN